MIMDVKSIAINRCKMLNLIYTRLWLALSVNVRNEITICLHSLLSWLATEPSSTSPSLSPLELL